MLNHASIGTEHMLLGLIREEESLAAKALDSLGVELEAVRLQVEEAVGHGLQPAGGQLLFTPRAKKVLELALREALQLGHNTVEPEHVLLGLIRGGDGVATQVLASLGVDLSRVRQRVMVLLSAGADTAPAEPPASTILDQFGQNLTRRGREGGLDPVIGREKEIERVMQVLSRRTKNNPILIGEPGVGKTTVVDGLAALIVNGQVPETLKGKQIYTLDLASLVAGSRYRGDFEDRLTKVVKEIRSRGDIILFIDEIHTLVGAGAAEGAIDAASILKPMLARGDLRTIGATTVDEFRRILQKDKPLERRFQAVPVGEPSVAHTIEMLKGLRERYEAHHQVSITDAALSAAANLADRYICDRYLPDKAIDLIDEAGARARLMTNRSEVDEDQIAEVLATWTGIPVYKLTEEETARLLRMEDELHKRIIGQEDAVNAVSSAIRRTRAGLKDPKRPSGSFIFAGPSGVGKSELSKALAEFLFGSEDALIQLDMSEFHDRYTVSRLVGAPPGYVGYDEGGQLTEKVRRRPFSVVLFDEIEKAHPDVFNTLLQILEDGRLTDGQGRLVDFTNTVIILTTNLGTAASATSIGFQSGPDSGYDQMMGRVIDELKRHLRPEFLNRIDHTIVFHRHSREQILLMVDLMTAPIAARLLDKGITLELTNATKLWLADKGWEPALGARPLRRCIQREVSDALAERILFDEVRPGQTVVVDVVDTEVVIHTKREDVPV